MKLPLLSLALLILCVGCGGGGSTGVQTGNHLTPFTQQLYFVRNTDTIALTGGALDGALPMGSTFTVEGFFKFPAATNGDVTNLPNNCSFLWNVSTYAAMDIAFYMNSLMQVGAYWNGSAGTSGNAPPGGGILAGTVPLNTWVHMAWVYDGTQERMYVGGQLIQSINLPGGVPPAVACTNGAALGANGARFDNPPTDSCLFYLAEFRVSNSVRYTGSTFTPPAGQLPSDANTLMLVNPSLWSSEPTSFTCGGLAAITGTPGAGSTSSTAPSLQAYTP